MVAELQNSQRDNQVADDSATPSKRRKVTVVDVDMDDRFIDVFLLLRLWPSRGCV